jgi:nucleotide-binding universal stress UspA family protein
MATFKRILVPTDFGEASTRAVETAVSLARESGAVLVLAHAWEIPAYAYSGFVFSSGDMVSALEDAAKKMLGDALADVKKTVPSATSILRMGIAWEQILEAAKATDADLIVMGTHGRRALAHALLGSIAEKVVRLSPIPVLTVRGILG